MSESASDPRVALQHPLADPTPAEVPAQLWLRSGRPLMGTFTRIYLSFALIASALIFVPRGPAYWGLIAGGVLSYFLFPLVIQGLLAPLERRVLAVRRREATALLQEVRARRVVRQFAPHAWLTLQEGRLHLRRGDGKAAARAFTETVRLSRGADAPGLISAQAHALLIADQPEQTRELLQALAKKQTLTPSDELHLGLAMLAGKGHAREALAHVQAAESKLGPHPRVLAGLALALHRADQADAALTALQRAQDALGGEPDPFDEALVQRAVKLLRPVQKAQQKRERKHGEPREAVARVAAAPGPAEHAAAPTSPAADARAKSQRKAKKEERRAARRAAKAEKRTQPEPVKAKKIKPAKSAKAASPKPVVTTTGAGKLDAKPQPAVATKPHSGVETAPGVETKTTLATQSPVAEKAPVIETQSPAAEKAAVVQTPVAEKAAVVQTPVVEKSPVAEKPPVRDAPVLEKSPVVETKSPVLEKTPLVETKQPVLEKMPVIEAKPQPVEKTPVLEGSPVVEAKPSQPAAGPARPGLPRLPAPPPGKSLFGSVGPSAPRLAAPLVPSVPIGGGLPRAPAAQPVAKPFAPPAVGATAVRPPTTTVTAALPPVAPAAPRMTLPTPPVAAPRSEMPAALVRPPAAFVPAAPLRSPAVVVPSAPIATAPSVAPPKLDGGLAEVLTATDDEWDDMLNALEADGPAR